MLARVTVLAAFFAAILSVPQTVHGAAADALVSCPGYRAALEAARGALVRGARAEAVLALERAKTALQHCNPPESAHPTRAATGRGSESTAAL